MSLINDKNDKVDMIMRQTDYDHATATEKLAEHNDDVMQVIRAYLSAGKIAATTAKLSTNQQIYKEIRGMMDDAARTYLAKRANEETS
jgi:hypothetical protein